SAPARRRGGPPAVRLRRRAVARGAARAGVGRLRGGRARRAPRRRARRRAAPRRRPAARARRERPRGSRRSARGRRAAGGGHARGLGRAGEGFRCPSAVAVYGRAAWVGLGGRGLATHLVRTRALHEGRTLSAVTADLAHALGVASRILPMSDEAVRTTIRTP